MWTEYNSLCSYTKKYMNRTKMWIWMAKKTKKLFFEQNVKTLIYKL